MLWRESSQIQGNRTELGLKNSSDANKIVLILTAAIIALALIVIIVVFIFIPAFLSGVGDNINFSPPPLEGVRSYIAVNYTEVINTNYSIAKEELEELGYNVNITVSGEVFDTKLNFHSDNISGSIWSLTYKNGTEMGRIRIQYNPYQNLTHQNKTLAFEHMKSKAEEIATICNITLDWEQATIVYEPEWYYGRLEPNAP